MRSGNEGLLGRSTVFLGCLFPSHSYLIIDCKQVVEARDVKALWVLKEEF